VAADMSNYFCACTYHLHNIFSAAIGKFCLVKPIDAVTQRSAHGFRDL